MRQINAFGTAIIRIGTTLHQIERLQPVEVGAHRHGLETDTAGNIGLLAAIDGGNRQKGARLTWCEPKPRLTDASLEGAVEKTGAAVEQEGQ